MFSPSLFKLLHLHSNRHIYEQKKQQNNSKENIKTTEQQKSPSQTLRDIYFSRRFVGWRSGRGLDILYFCFFSFFFSFFYVFFFVFLFQCFRLVFLSFCIYNRKTHINTLNKQGDQKNNKTTEKTEVPGSIPIVLCSTKFMQFTRVIVTCS